MFLFAAFQSHLSKIMLKDYGNRNLQWSPRGKRSLLPFLGRHSPDGDIFVVCETKVFYPRISGEYELDCKLQNFISSSRNVLASSSPCVLRTISLGIHDLESELTLSQAG